MSRIRDRKVTINPDSVPDNDLKSNISPAFNLTALDKASGKVALPVPEHAVLPQHLSPESTAIAEKCRLYIRNLPYGTTEEVLQDLPKDLSVCTRNVDRLLWPTDNQCRETLKIPYDIRAKQIDHYAIVEFTDSKEVPKAKKTVFHYRLAGHEIQGTTKLSRDMLQEPRPYFDEARSGHGAYLRITNLSFASSEHDIRFLFPEYSMLKIPRPSRYQKIYS